MEEGKGLCMFQHVKRVRGQTQAEVVYAHVWKIQEKGSRIVCLKLKDCTNVWEMEGNLSKLFVLGQCYGAGVHYLNSSKHRKLIGLR